MDENYINKDATKEAFVIPIDGLYSSFQKHLDIKNNGRIFFSGKFGIGKTFFLHEFFKNNEDKYDVFHLFPINYQISSAEDIIELLKYDVLIELLKKNGSIFQNNNVDGLKDKALLFYSFCKEKFSFNNFLSSVISSGGSIAELTANPNFAMLSKLGRPLVQLLKLDKEFQSFVKKYAAGEKGKVEKFLQEVRDKKIEETDYLSYLLHKKINEQKNNKRSVLILDDLDRIDPEHIFRILNVFSAHFNTDDDGADLPNKFGFDHIIIVGDCRNIENIFYHRYGMDTDFDGYFNKFFSYKKYSFNNNDIVSDYVDSLITNYGTKDDGNILAAMEKSGFVRIILGLILKDTISLDSKEKINLRQLLKLGKFRQELISTGGYPIDNSFSNRNNSIIKYINFSIKTLLSMYDGKDQLISAFKKIKSIVVKRDGNGKDYYGFLSRYLLEVILDKQFAEEVVVEDWEEYKITIKVKEILHPVTVDPKGKRTTRKLFYDLLILYIEEYKFENNPDQW